MKRISTTLFLLAVAFRLFAQTDTIPPKLHCKSLVQQPIGPTCLTTVTAAMALDATQSDLENGTVELGVRKRCTGTGFPENKLQVPYVLFSDEYNLELWARDTAGNTSSCMTEVFITDNAGVCEGWTNVFTLFPKADGWVGIAKGIVRLYATSTCIGDTIREAFPTYSNAGEWGGVGSELDIPAPGYSKTITAEKFSNPLNGVTSEDIALIYNHIHGIELLDSPYKIIAADVNMDNQVTDADIVLLESWLEGAMFTRRPTWRFLPDSFIFPDPANPFLTPFPEAVFIPNTDERVHYYIFLLGVKIGDVNFSADPLK